MKSLEQFEKELAKAADELERIGGTARMRDERSTEAGLKGDFVLPYSSLPKLHTSVWVNGGKTIVATGSHGS